MNITKWVLSYLARAYKLRQLSNEDKMKNDLDTWLLPSAFSWFDQYTPAVFLLGNFCAVPSSA